MSPKVHFRNKGNDEFLDCEHGEKKYFKQQFNPSIRKVSLKSFPIVFVCNFAISAFFVNPEFKDSYLGWISRSYDVYTDVSSFSVEKVSTFFFCWV